MKIIYFTLRIVWEEFLAESSEYKYKIQSLMVMFCKKKCLMYCIVMQIHLVLLPLPRTGTIYIMKSIEKQCKIRILSRDSEKRTELAFSFLVQPNPEHSYFWDEYMDE